MEKILLDKLTNYSVPSHAIKLIRQTRIVFMVGITGAGKDTILKRLLETGEYHHIVSHTTRKPRLNHGVLDRDGVDYHFIDFKTAENMLDEGGYVEAKQFSGNIYGTSVAEIQMAHDEGKIAISDVEVQGVAEYRSVSDKVIPIFILPPDFSTWQERLKGRHQEEGINEDDFRKRIKTALMEIQEALDKNYFEFVVNDKLENAVRIANEIAHGNFSDKKNHQAREVAKHLAEEIIRAGYQ